jgi:hypothetical protein
LAHSCPCSVLYKQFQEFRKPAQFGLAGFSGILPFHRRKLKQVGLANRRQFSTLNRKVDNPLIDRPVPASLSLEEDRPMKVLRAHDYPELMGRPAAPNLKALRRIMASFIAATVICFAICLSLIVRGARTPRPALHTAAPQCNCMGHCTRKGAR